MNTSWQEFLMARGARFDGVQAADFGRPDEELAEAPEGTVLAPLTQLAVIECLGEDAQSFLHNQLTSDVMHLPSQVAQYAGWCTAKGRLQASFILYRQPAGYRALLAADLLATTLKRLRMYVLRSRVTLGDLSGQQVVLGLSGPRADAALRAAGLGVPEAPMAMVEGGGATVVRLGDPRFLIVAEIATAPALFDMLAGLARPVGVPVWQWLDVRAGIVLITAAIAEEFVPQMVDFDKIGGVSFRKGCYPGQEVVARTHYLGRVKRHLYRLHGDAPMAVGGALFPAGHPDQSGGLIAGAAPAPGGGYAALAVIRENVIQAGEVALEMPGVALSDVKPVTAAGNVD